MATRPGVIPVAAAERLSDEYNCPVVIVFAIEARRGDRFTVTTYGKSRALCRHAADLGRKFSEAVLGGTVAPAGVEPTDVPDTPTVFEGKRRE